MWEEEEELPEKQKKKYNSSNKWSSFTEQRVYQLFGLAQGKSRNKNNFKIK